jgi:hypothetical protein
MIRPAETIEEGIPSAQALLQDATSSFWLKSALQTALQRDPVDALNDALVLAATLDAHLRSVFGLSEPESNPQSDDRRHRSNAAAPDGLDSQPDPLHARPDRL